ncbi:peptidase dimerization domain-containing protein [Bacteriovorax sp. DB6_IX]|uniref:peptidase dimerization domain-containing protein n=1 Tax=Bacteriovorax sp. DB6_IX TaxID=1353530 RepID=UPI00038A4A37|nr:peptidase dimerization domain-containing protein [Bacteriovorax sp. DB6_IX]EQC51757.1 peptidase dimerization domain protein [Bacteriovorax sp. DB6_IX]
MITKKGINACSEMAMQVSKLHQLTDYQKDLTINVGRIEGGKQHNIVSDYAYAQVEARFPCHASRHFVIEKIEEALDNTHVSSLMEIKVQKSLIKSSTIVRHSVRHQRVMRFQPYIKI